MHKNEEIEKDIKRLMGASRAATLLGVYNYVLAAATLGLVGYSSYNGKIFPAILWGAGGYIFIKIGTREFKIARDIRHTLKEYRNINQR